MSAQPNPRLSHPNFATEACLRLRAKNIEDENPETMLHDLRDMPGDFLHTILDDLLMRPALSREAAEDEHDGSVEELTRQRDEALYATEELGNVMIQVAEVLEGLNDQNRTSVEMRLIIAGAAKTMRNALL